MEAAWLAWILLGVGLALVGSELFHATFTALFLGVASILVAGLAAVGLVTSVPGALLSVSVLALAMGFALRPLAMKFLPARRTRDRSNEDDDAFGQIVDVLEPVLEGEVRGRIRFQGTTWPALCVDGSIPAGGKAKLVARQKLAWIVEPLGELEASNVVPKA